MHAPVRPVGPPAVDVRATSYSEMMTSEEQPATPRDATALTAGTEAVLRAFAGLTDDELALRPAPGEWNAWEIAYHLLDIERWYLAKLCEAVSDGPAEALARFMQVWARLRAETAALAAALPADRLDTPGLLSGVPDWTPRTLLAAIAAHDREHVGQVWQAIGRDHSPPEFTLPPADEVRQG